MHLWFHVHLATKNLERYLAWGSVWGSIVGSVGGLLGVPFGGMLGVDILSDFNMFDTFFFDKTFLELHGGSAIFHFSEKINLILFHNLNYYFSGAVCASVCLSAKKKFLMVAHIKKY